MSEAQARQRLAEVMGRLSQLPSENLEPPQFFANFLQLSIAASGCKGGAIWIIQPEQTPQCYCHLNLELCNLNDQAQQQAVFGSIGQTAQEPIVILPAANQVPDGQQITNQCNNPLFFKPLKAANQVAMVLQLIAPENLSQEGYQSIASLLEQCAKTAETYLAHRRASVLEDDRKALTQLLKYTEAVHDSLDPEKVIYQIVNAGRDAMQCQRVCVWIDPKVKRGLRAVSGIDKPDRRAVLMQAIEKLSRHCLKINKPIVASRQQLVELPEDDNQTELLKDYFNVSKMDQIFLQPVNHDDRLLGVVVAEGFDQDDTTNMAGLISSIANHGAVALNNALDLISVSMVNPLARLKKNKKETDKKHKTPIIFAILIIVVAILCLYQWPVTIKSDCRLVPVHKRSIQSPFEFYEIQQIVRESGNVNAGETIAQLDTQELYTRLVETKQELAREAISRDSFSTSEEEKQKSKLKIVSLEQTRKLLEEQIEKCNIKASIDGTILTPDLKKLEGTKPQKGQEICAIADLNEWQVVLEIPHEEIDWVISSVNNKKEGGSEVTFILESYPQTDLKATIANVDQIAQKAQMKESQQIFEIRLNFALDKQDLSDDELEHIRNGLREDMTGRAKITTVSRPLGYVMLRKVIRFFRVTFF
ncbi:MAG: efflux RND transporter periplasmic adaptor subunit [Phycisphaerae bacterium]|nr:efflux RND transporter periplasmic adaptor subunit [Phycisphaerae bacterium]